MGDMAIQTLETAAQILMAPPNIVTSEQRHQAESVFLQFRGTANPYRLCREILETSTSDYVLFEAASLLKTALIREWSSLSEDDLTSLRQYLLSYLLNKDTPPFLREKIMQTIAIIIKRGSIDDSGRGRKALLSELEKIILDSPLKQQKLACSLTLAIMQEYAITVKSADVGLIWEVHYRLKKSFELLDLKRIFRFTVGILEQFTRSGCDVEDDQVVLLKQLLTIVETVLCWGQVTPLLTKRFIGAIEAIYESDKAPALRLPAIWKDTILEPQLTQLFFDLHMKVRLNPDLSNHSLTCLEQLASLSGVVVSENTMKQSYLENYVNIFLRTMSQILPTAREMLGIADIYRRLIQFFLPSMIATLPAEFLDTLTKLTTHCIRGSIIEESVNDDTMWREALNKFLHTWSCFTQDNESFSQERLQSSCIEIFNTYLQCRLAPPDGTRGTDHRDIADDIKDDVEEDERELHNYVLAILGSMARKAPAHCCHVLNTLLQSRTQKLEEQLQLMHVGEIPAVSSEHLTSLYEDLHWILMIIGHFIALDCTEGETVLIPSEITQFCIAENANIEQCLKFLSGEVTSDENVDPIVRLVGSVIRLSACEVVALEAGLGPALSPEMSASTSWLLKLWANSYLAFQNSLYTEISPTLEACWGSRASCVWWVQAQLVRRARAALRYLHTQPAAAAHALRLLAILAHAHEHRQRLAMNEEFLSLVAWEADGSDLPGHLRKELHRAFAATTSYAQGEGRTRLVNSTVILKDKLMNIINSQLDTEPVRNLLANTLDCFTGVTEGIRDTNQAEDLVQVLISALTAVPLVIFRYRNYAGVVLPALRLMAAAARKLLHARPEHSFRFLEIVSDTFDVYGRWISGKVSNITPETEEEAYEDVCALLDLVVVVGRVGTASDVRGACARGLRLALPLVTPTLLAVPRLALAAYRVLRDLEAAGQITEKTLPIEDFKMVIHALQVGLTAVSCDVSTLCCDTIIGLATKLRGIDTENPYVTSLLSLVELLLMLILKMEIPPDTIPAAGSAIYCLTCVKPEMLQGLAAQLIHSIAINDPANVPRLEQAFAVLTTGVIFDGLRSHRIKFQDNFDKFLTSIHGFLIVK